MNHNLHSDWTSFVTLVLTPAGVTVDTIQYIEIRRAFYAGAAAMFTLVTEASADDNEEVCVLHMQTLSDEVDQFATDLKKGRV